MRRRKSRPAIVDEDEDDEFDEEDAVVYRPDPRRMSTVMNANPFASRRPEHFEDEMSDGDLQNYKREPPASHIRRRSSQFRGGLDEKTRSAMTYQDGVMTRPGAPLTAEALKHVRNGGSTRSTRSTESRDESDYKHSATTRTTHSNNDDDDITIKLPRGGVIEVGGAKITCATGGDVSIGRGNRQGSDRATERDTATVHDEEDEDEDEDEEDEDEEDEEEDYAPSHYRGKSRTMRNQKRLPAPDHHVGSLSRSRDPRSMAHPPALAQVPYNNYAASSYGAGRRTPGPRAGQQAAGVYDPYAYAETFDDDDEDYESGNYYDHPQGNNYYAQQYNY